MEELYDEVIENENIEEIITNSSILEKNKALLSHNPSEKTFEMYHKKS